MKGVRSSLVVGDRVVSRCDDGLLEVEYALFDAEDVIVAATLGFGVYEQGYLTTAGFARERLLAAGINATLARDSFAALRAGHLRALARSPCVLRVIDQLTPYEGFEGGVYNATDVTYAGAWLDLEALALACPLAGAALVFQAMHLFLVVEEVGDDVPVRLLTADATVGKRPGHRTWHRVPLEIAGRVPTLLRSMRIPARSARPDARDDDEVRDELLHNLRARSTPLSASRNRLHLHTLASRLARTGNTPPIGVHATTPPPPPPRLGATPVPPAAAAAKRTPVPPAPDIIVTDPADPQSDPLPSFEELEASSELLQGDEHLLDVAGVLSASAKRAQSLPELAILAARSWLAAGEAGHARHLAKQVAENAAAADNVRLQALEILDATSPTDETLRPPPTGHIKPKPIVVIGEEPVRVAPPGASHPPFSSEPALAAVKVPTPAPPPPKRATPAPPPPPSPPPPPPWRAENVATPAPPPESSVQDVTATVLPRVEEGSRRSPPPEVLSEPAPSAAHKPVAPLRPGRVQILESLALPEGATEEMLPEGAVPKDPLQMRIAMTRQARALGRDYRLWYGTTLQTSPIAIEVMQRHLRRRFDDGADERGVKKLEAELTRHGAALSEILARTIGAEWVDVSGTQPGHWSMVVPPDMRVWPIGRVYRFFQQGHREADLVAFYLDLEARSRSGDD